MIKEKKRLFFCPDSEMKEGMLHVSTYIQSSRTYVCMRYIYTYLPTSTSFVHHFVEKPHRIFYVYRNLGKMFLEAKSTNSTIFSKTLMSVLRTGEWLIIITICWMFNVHQSSSAKLQIMPLYIIVPRNKDILASALLVNPSVLIVSLGKNKVEMAN